LRIVVIHNLKRGGGWRRLREQASRLDGEVLELTLATAAPITDDPLVVPYSELAPRRTRTLRPPLRYADAIRLALAWRRLGELAKSLKPDVVFANACQFLHAPPVLLSREVPTLYFCDEPRRVDYEPEAAATRNPRTLALYAPLYTYERRLDAASVRRARSIATNSHYSAGRLRIVYGVEAEVVPMGVAETFLHGPLDRPRGDVVLSVGMLTAVKSHDLVILATSLSAQLRRVTVVSPRPNPPEERRLRAIARDVGISLNVRVGITDEDLRREYENARVTAYLARGEPFGLAALEAQACGCPVIAASDGGLSEAIVDGLTGFAVPRDPAAAASALDLLCETDRSERAQEAAAKHARAWTWDISAVRLQSLLDDLLHAR
jgi:glycosyltransferase involved in cell wall biosynthesis